MNKINCLGDHCPIPLLKAKKKLATLKAGESFLLVSDHSCVVESINNYFKKSICICTYNEVLNGVWEITITKT